MKDVVAELRVGVKDLAAEDRAGWVPLALSDRVRDLVGTHRGDAGRARPGVGPVGPGHCVG